ncbi:MAG: RagB/SusD family nutrient uptake outer membrane protein [Bacteroidales bacterium]|nr:RagB/SusD family nutrient uptake outer membrane protein [Bacteroidales bacterium]
MIKYISRFSILLFIFALVGCEDGLDLIPTGSVSEKIYWQREKDAELAVNAAYNCLDDWNLIDMDGSTDIAYHAASGTGSFFDVGAGNIDPTNWAITDMWIKYYRGIRRANDVIKNIDLIQSGDAETMARIKAEARFLRAYYYTQLTSLWGGVPLILEPLTINVHTATTDKATIVEFVINELNDIISSNALPLSYVGDNIGRATKGAAYALLARVAIRNDMFNVARDAAKAVMDLGVYELYPDYVKLFQYAGENCKEVIFDRQYSIGGDIHDAFNHSSASLGGGSYVEPNRYLLKKYEYKGLVNPNDPYENLDPRFGFTCYYTGQPCGNTIYNSWPNSTTVDRVNSSEWSTDYGFNVRKWVDYEGDVANPANGSINMILIRYADVLLMYAESKIELNQIDQSVYDAINAVRQRPTVEMPAITTGKTQAQLRAIVRNERTVEFAFEGLRTFDVNRWKIGEDKIGVVQGCDYIDATTGKWTVLTRGYTRTFRTDRDYLWPIPQSEIEINENITQNPNY